MRSTMTSLVTRVRLLVGDPAGAAQFYADDTVQDALDEHRLDVRYYSLVTKPTFEVGQAAEWHDYYDQRYRGAWEDDVVFASSSYAALTPDTSENLTGHWAFTLSQPPPVYLSGKTYDVYAAAADLVEQRASRVMLDFDVTSDRQSVLRSQKHKMLLEQAKTLRKKQRVGSLHGYRGDTRPSRRAC